MNRGFGDFSSEAEALAIRLPMMADWWRRHGNGQDLIAPKSPLRKLRKPSPKGRKKRTKFRVQQDYKLN